jgi:hypothetical protein
MPEKKEIKWGPKDCSIRLLYKMTSQKLVAFVFAAGAILILIGAAKAAQALTPDVVVNAIKAVRDIAIALLAIRGVQGITGAFNKKTDAESGNGKENCDDHK